MSDLEEPNPQQSNNQQPNNQQPNNQQPNNQQESLNVIKYLIELLLEAFKSPSLVKLLRPTLTNLLIIFAFFSGGKDLAVLISEGITQTEESTETIIFSEQPINIDKACNTPSIKVQAIEDLGIPENADITVTAKLSSSEELWPVFRWKCNFKIKLNNKKDEFLKTKEISLGINLDEYCNSEYNNAWYAIPKKHTDPNSWYCTLVHYEDDDEQSPNESVSKLQ